MDSSFMTVRPESAPTREGSRLNALLIAYHYFPENNGGVQRAAAMKRYLPQHGVDVTLLTHGGKPVDVPEERAAGVVRAFDVTRHSLPFALFAAYRLLQRATTLFGAAGLRYSLWRRNAIRQAERLIAHRRPDVLIATFPPPETIDVALEIARRHRIPVIADFRDGLIFEPLETPGRRAAALGRYLNELERRVISDAAAIVTVSEPISGHYRDAGASRVETIANGFDSRERRDVIGERPFELDRDRINFVYTGRLDRSRAGTRIAPFLEAVAALGEESAGGRLLFHFFGEYTQSEMRAFQPFVGRGVIRVHGLVSRARALLLQRHADALLLVTATGQRSIATGKLFEYLGAGRPIVALTEGTVAESIVRETESGWVVAPDDMNQILGVLRKIAENPAVLQTICPNPLRVKRYERSEQMAQYATLVREICRSYVEREGACHDDCKD